MTEPESEPRPQTRGDSLASTRPVTAQLPFVGEIVEKSMGSTRPISAEVDFPMEPPKPKKAD